MPFTAKVTKSQSRLDPQIAILTQKQVPFFQFSIVNDLVRSDPRSYVEGYSPVVLLPKLDTAIAPDRGRNPASRVNRNSCWATARGEAFRKVKQE
jgi:hypothetical protein